MRIKLLITFGVLALCLYSCFTGVDSTPRISAGDVRHRQAADSTAEQIFIRDIVPPAPRTWTPGQSQFLVDAGAPLQRIFDGTSAAPELMAGRLLTFRGVMTEPSLTGNSMAVILLSDKAGNNFNYRTSVSYAAFDTLPRLDIPYMVNVSLVDRLNSLLSGNTYFIKTQHWYDGDGKEVYGLRHIPVTIDSVSSGTSLYPAAVFFHLNDDQLKMAAGIAPGTKRMVLMTAGHSMADNRNFDRLFSFKDPRRMYPDIQPEIWELIIRSRVRPGMSREECRLALGAPDETRQIPSRGTMRDIWQYSQGFYLIFDDGYLINYRQ